MIVTVYTSNGGRITGHLVTLTAGYAVVRPLGRTYTVTTHDVLRVEVVTDDTSA